MTFQNVYLNSIMNSQIFKFLCVYDRDLFSHKLKLVLKFKEFLSIIYSVDVGLLRMIMTGGGGLLMDGTRRKV